MGGGPTSIPLGAGSGIDHDLSPLSLYGLFMTSSTPTSPPKTLGYLLNRWYFADPEKTQVARVVSVSDSYAKVELRRLANPGDLNSAEDRPIGVSVVSPPNVRDAVNATRKSLGKEPVQWSRLTRHLARAGRADGVEDLERSLRHADEDIVAEFSSVVEGDLDDIPAAELDAAIPRRELGPHDRSALLLATVDRLMGEFEEQVMLVKKKADGLEAASQFVDKLIRLPVPPSVEYDRALAAARKSPQPMNVQDAIFEAIGSCVAWVRHHRGIESTEDIRLDAPLHTAPRPKVEATQAPVEGHEQGDLLTGEFTRVAPPKRGRPNYQLPLDAIPECDLVTVARAMTGTELPDLTVQEAKKLVRPFLKSPDQARKIAEIVASETAKRTRPSTPGE